MAKFPWAARSGRCVACGADAPRNQARTRSRWLSQARAQRGLATLVAIIFSILPLTRAYADGFASGTYAAMYYSTDFTAVAIDSRVTDESGDLLSDHECKILPLSDHLFFFSVGIKHMPITKGGDVVELVKQAQREMNYTD
jgi:hypothetical protein